MGRAAGRLPRGDGGSGIGSSAPGWTRRDTQAQVAATYCADPRAVPAVDTRLEVGMLDTAKIRAHMIVASSFELYREIALSALSLIRRI
jgi:hypothetical protein